MRAREGGGRPALTRAWSVTVGATVFLEGSKDKVQPEAGMALVFQHNIYHEGERLKSGTKYIMRSDAMFRRHEV